MQQHQAQTDPAPQQPQQQHDGQQQQATAPGWQSYSSVFTAAKAGMGGVDQQKVKQVVYEMSKVRPAGLIVLHVQAEAGHHLHLSTLSQLAAGHCSPTTPTHCSAAAPACRTRHTTPKSSASRRRRTLASRA